MRHFTLSCDTKNRYNELCATIKVSPEELAKIWEAYKSFLGCYNYDPHTSTVRFAMITSEERNKAMFVTIIMTIVNNPKY